MHDRKAGKWLDEQEANARSGAGETLVVERSFYDLLTSATKVMVDRLGGEVEFSGDELTEALNEVTGSTHFDFSTDTWMLTNRREPPPDVPTNVSSASATDDLGSSPASASESRSGGLAGNP